MTDQALTGLRVLDLSRVLAGPLCSQMLADHGADVIKVEPPAGDETRTWGPPFVDEHTSSYYAALNRNKRNIVLDLRSDDGRAVLRRLLADSDVLIENFRAGTLAKWGLPDEELLASYPRLVHCRVTGFGLDGPMGGKPGYDAVAQAYSGLMSVNGEATGPALRVGVPVVDMATGMLAFSGVLLALRERDVSGRGQVVDCSLLDTAINLLHPHSAAYLADGTLPVRSGSAHPSIAPYDAFPAADGDLFISAGNDTQFRKLLAVLGIPELADDPRFASNPLRVKHVRELRALLVERVGDFDRLGLTKQLLDVGVPASPVNDVGEALTDDHVRERGLVVEHDGYRGIANPISLHRTPAAVHTAPRPAGADTREVLGELGIEPALVDRVVGAQR
ncbi:CoA transferase [Flexivirga sp. ID2601S]|uniref:CoA transferase n=1 Tax=Flexivirga aerilata TaxID=1656889 RepID=A0A849AB04_9MICO|nr:CoA transferase [Flexivirga aerilata]NNG37705.1 CoA transferase [Flexivirga aerilata]